MNEYWRQREEQAQAEYALTEEQYAEQLNSIYDYMLDQVKKEINGFYSKYMSAENITYAEATKRVAELDIKEYERKAKKYVEEKNFSAQANEEMRLYNATMNINRLELLKANIGLEMVSNFDELNKVMGEDLTERALQEMARQAGILGATIKDNAKMASSIVGASFHNATFSDRIWMYQDQLKAELETLLRQGLIQGRNPNELARHINNLFDTGKYNCERLLRTELARVQSEAQMRSFAENGFDMYQFNALGTACPVCRALDGKHFRVADMMPGENAAPLHPSCRCTESAWMDDAAFNEWLNSYADHGMSYQDWLKDRPVAVGAEEEAARENELSKALGKENYDKLRAMVDSCGDENLKALWDKYEDQIGIGDIHYKGRAHEQFGKIYFDIDDVLNGNSYETPMQVVFHEAGHAIDYWASRGSGVPLMYSAEYESGVFPKTIKAEVNKLVNDRAATIKQDFNDHASAGDWEYLVDKGYITRGEYNFYLRQGEWAYNKEPAYSKSMAYSSVTSELTELDLVSRRNISDIAAGATRNRIDAGIRHSQKYWSSRQDSLATEAFAEMCDATLASPAALENVKKYLPESYEVWQNMVKDLATEGGGDNE